MIWHYVTVFVLYLWTCCWPFEFGCWNRFCFWVLWTSTRHDSAATGHSRAAWSRSMPRAAGARGLGVDREPNHARHAQSRSDALSATRIRRAGRGGGASKRRRGEEAAGRPWGLRGLLHVDRAMEGMIPKRIHFNLDMAWWMKPIGRCTRELWLWGCWFQDLWRRSRKGSRAVGDRNQRLSMLQVYRFARDELEEGDWPFTRSLPTDPSPGKTPEDGRDLGSSVAEVCPWTCTPTGQWPSMTGVVSYKNTLLREVKDQVLLGRTGLVGYCVWLGLCFPHLVGSWRCLLSWAKSRKKTGYDRGSKQLAKAETMKTWFWGQFCKENPPNHVLQLLDSGDGRAGLLGEHV